MDGGAGRVTVSGGRLLTFEDGSSVLAQSSLRAKKGLDIGASGGSGVVELLNGARGQVSLLAADTVWLAIGDHREIAAEHVMRVGADGATGMLLLSGAGTTFDVHAVDSYYGLSQEQVLRMEEVYPDFVMPHGIVKVGTGGNAVGTIVVADQAELRVGAWARGAERDCCQDPTLAEQYDLWYYCNTARRGILNRPGFTGEFVVQ